jgi:hypothetical protein
MREPVIDSATLLAALAYARRGWAVFPVHSITDGRCSCGNHACTKQALRADPRLKDLYDLYGVLKDLFSVTEHQEHAP